MKKISLLLVLIMICQMFVLPISGIAEEAATEIEHYQKIMSPDELQDGEKYLIILCSVDNDKRGIMLPENGNEGFPVDTAAESFKSGKVSAVYENYSGKEWTFTKSGDGWKIGNGEQYAKINKENSGAILDSTGDVFTVGSVWGDCFEFTNSESWVLNYHDGSKEVASWSSDTAKFFVYKYVSGTPAPEHYQRITLPSELQDGGQYLIIPCSVEEAKRGIMLPQKGTSGFSIDTTADSFKTGQNSNVFENHRDKEWTFTKSGDGWKIGNGEQYAKLGSDDTASLDETGDIFTVETEWGDCFKFKNGSNRVFNYFAHLSEMCSYASDPAIFFIYKYVPAATPEPTPEPVPEQEHYRRITSPAELEDGEKYLIVYCDTWANTESFDSRGIMLPKDGTEGFPVAEINSFNNGENTVIANHRDKEWTFTKSGDGWKIGNSEKYAKLGDNKAFFDETGDVFNVVSVWGNCFHFTKEGGVLNYHQGTKEVSFWTDGAATFYIYKYVPGIPITTPEPEPEQEHYTKINSLDELQDGEKYLLIYNDTWTGQNRSGIMLPQDGTEGFPIEITDSFNSNTVIANHRDKEWAFTKSGDGWKIGNGKKYAKLGDGKAFLNREGDVFNLELTWSGFTFTKEDGVLNYHQGPNEVGFWPDAPAPFYIYKYVPGIPVSPTPPPSSGELINDDFEQYNSADDMNLYDITGRHLCDIVDFGGNKALKMGLNSDTDTIAATRNFNKVQDGILEVRLKMRTTNTSLTVPIVLQSSDSTKEIRFLEFQNGGAYVDNEKTLISSIRANVWYDVCANFNMNTKVYNVVLTDEKGNMVKSSDISFAEGEIDELSRIKLACWYKLDADAYFDDLSVRYTVANPEINDNSVVFYDSEGNASTERKEVSTKTSKIVIDFKTYMDIDSYDGITLINRNTNKEVNASINKTQKTYEMQLNELLDGNTVYVLTIPGTIRSYNGIELGKTSTVSFVTAQASTDLSVEIEGIFEDNEEISDLNRLIEAGGYAEIKLKYLNGTHPQGDTDICIITSYYSGEKLIKTMISNKQIGKDTINAMLTYDLPIADLEGVDCIKVFVLDNMENIKPYCKNLVFK